MGEFQDMSSATVSSFPASTVLSRSEIERIRSSVSDINSRCNASNNGSSASRREELRRLSQERQKNWPNTLEALRKKKENWKKEKLEREEAERRKIDEEEAKLREEQRRITIEKARQVKANNTDKMKLLKSKLMHAEVLDVSDWLGLLWLLWCLLLLVYSNDTCDGDGMCGWRVGRRGNNRLQKRSSGAKNCST